MHLKKQISEIQAFLCRAKELVVQVDKVKLNNKPWNNGKINKTQKYLAETGIGITEIVQTIQELQVKNFSYADNDRNEKFPDEEFWFFGITKCLVDKEEKLYIKLKIREIQGQNLLIMSFHPEAPGSPEEQLIFPYADDTDMNK